MHTVIIGAQFGSEGKGAVCQHLDRTEQFDCAVRVGGPNAGHSIILGGVKIALRHVPAFIESGIKLYIAQHALVDVGVLMEEIGTLLSLGYDVRDRLMIDPMATVIRPEDKTAEAGMHESIGSTAKGIGAAEAATVMRTGLLAKDCGDLAQFVGKTRTEIARHKNVAIETTQGIGLGLRAGFYPFCTSRDISPAQAIADCGLATNKTRNVLVARTFPIRVAGNSGPLNRETSWDELSAASGGAIEREYTTVTKKVRRIGWWDKSLIDLAAEVCGNSGEVFLTFCDYLELIGRPDLIGQAEEDIAATGLSVSGRFYGPEDCRMKSQACPYSS